MAVKDEAPDALRQGPASGPQLSIKPLNATMLSYLRRIFESHAGPDNRWTRAQATTFVRKVQDHDAATPAADRLLGQPDVDLHAFLAYLTSADSDLTLPWSACDLTLPLASYFINSSHNTYLTGNQLSSDSTTAAYTNVLLRGCRCVEVDVWDGDESDAESSASSVGDGARAKSSWRTRFGTLKEKLPDSLATKLEKTKLGKRADEGDEHAADEHAADKHAAVEHAADKHAAVKHAAVKHAAVPEPEVAMLEPRVFHGYTLTKEVPFRDVCKAIRESAFAATDLPLIVSLEVHCSPSQQEMMVRIMEEAWAGLLVAAPDDGAVCLPGPDDLRGKILVKVKYVPPDVVPSDEPDSGDDSGSPPADAAAKPPPKKRSKIIQALSRLGVYTRGVSFKAWSQPEATMPTHVFSLSERKFLDHNDRNAADLFRHNERYLVRVYPSGLRIASSNLDPPLFWGAGAQIVALNWQQMDEGMMLNEAMFAGTGGFVLKPDGYRPYPKPEQPALCPKTLSLAITFLAAQSIPLPEEDKSAKHFNPYIKTELHVEGSQQHCHHRHGLAQPDRDAGGLKARTRTHHGRDVDLGGERASFAAVAGLVEELTFVRFTVRDDEIGRDDLAAWACVRLDRLGQGYRFIRLRDSRGALTDGVVLVKVEKTLTPDGAA